ncbi:hypothetical protein JOM56_015508 [Amanita muscaria]
MLQSRLTCYVSSHASSRQLRRSPDLMSTTIRRLISLGPAVLKDGGSGLERGTGASFSKVTYAQAAPLVGLHPGKQLRDIGTFEIHRSRIPTHLFRSIVIDMDIMLMQYGAPPQHKTEEARSRFFSPVFNHLVKQFAFMLRNEPETMIDGHIGAQGCIEYFKAFGAVAVLCIEMRLKVGNDDERLKIIAQVIAECDRCNLENSAQGFFLPIHCIFTDGLSYEFFKFERNPNPSFIRGCFPGDPYHLQRGLKVPDYSFMATTLPFILQLRCACETIFDIMLSAYIAGLKAYYIQSEENGRKQGSKIPSLDGWDRALQSADRALAGFREAAVQRKDGDLDSADATVDQALLALQESTGAVPTFYRSELIMKDWDEVEVWKLERVNLTPLAPALFVRVLLFSLYVWFYLSSGLLPMANERLFLGLVSECIDEYARHPKGVTTSGMTAFDADKMSTLHKHEWGRVSHLR